MGHSIDLDHMVAHPIGALPAYTISPNFNQGMEGARPVLPLYGSYHKGGIVALFLLDYSGLLPISGHVISISLRRRLGSGVRRFGAKETQPLIMFILTIW